jgi:hypothetical protein
MAAASSSRTGVPTGEGSSDPTFYGKISAYQPVIKRGWLENPA